MTDETKQRGENIWHAFDLTIAAWQEANAMLNELKDVFVDQRLPKEILKLEPVKKDLYGDVFDDVFDGTVRTALFRQWRLIPRKPGPRKSIGVICAIAVLGGQKGLDSLFNKMPYLAVGYWYGEEEDEFWRPDDSESWTWTEEGEEATKWATAATDKLIVTSSKKTAKYSEEGEWYFCLPLLLLNNRDDLRRLVVEPTLRLLYGEPPSEVLAVHPALRFKIDDGNVPQLVQGVGEPH